jgi:glycosyltransferase involved in cell wall biosynthesis
VTPAPTVSVILAAYDEAATIADVVAGCRAQTEGVVEILVVDDGSADGTGEVALAAGARVLRLWPNGGKGAAIRHGIAHAKGELLLFLDADGQDDPRDIPRLLAAFPDPGGADMVVGSRFLGTFGPGAITLLNRMGNLLLTGVVNVLYGARLTDTQAGFRVVRRAVAERCVLSACRYDIEVDLLCGVLRLGGKVIEVPVGRAARAHGVSHLRSFRDGARIFRRILARRFA